VSHLLMRPRGEVDKYLRILA